LDLLHLIHSHSTRDYIQYRAIAILHTFRFTVAHALGFSVFTSRILATDLSQSHCHLKTYTKSSLHSLLIPCHYSAAANSEDSTQFNSSAPKLISWQTGVPKLDSIQFLCSQAHIPAGWRLETTMLSRVFCVLL
jgi:hypothetical protein